MFNKVAIIGVGLIGGSLGLEIKRKKLARHVVGCGRSRANLAVAKRRRLLDEATTDLAFAVSDADLVVLGAPALAIIGHIGRIGPMLKKGAIVMDVASTKGDIVRAAEKYVPAGVYFVGAHPLAGTEKAGAAAALPNLFKGKRCLLTSRRGTPSTIVKKVELLWHRLGSRTELISSQKHDQILAVTSHLPQMAAYALMQATTSLLPVGRIKSMSGCGFRDTTRIAASPAEMWRDIALSNRRPLLGGLKRLQGELKTIERLLAQGNAAQLSRYFDRAARLRNKL